VGLSNKEKQKTIRKMLEYSNVITLDATSFDNCHNEFIKQIWFFFIQTVIDYKGDYIELFVTKKHFYAQFCKKRSKILYSFTERKRGKTKRTNYCSVDIGDRLASGSVYTTLLNTMLMVSLIEYTGYLPNIQRPINYESSTSGDDANVKSPKERKPDLVCEDFYSVFCSNNEHFFSVSGVKLKVLLFSYNILDAVPCSLDCFNCAKCGPKLVNTS